MVEALKDGTKVAPTATGSVRLKGGQVPDLALPLTIQTVTEELIVSGEGMTSKLRKSSADNQVFPLRSHSHLPMVLFVVVWKGIDVNATGPP